MKIVKWLAILVIAFVALFVVIGLLLPSVGRRSASFPVT